MIDYKDENLGHQKKIFKGNLLQLPIYKFKISELKFNPHNTRIIDVVESKFGNDIFDKEDIYSEEVQELIMKSLVNTHSDDINKELLRSINNGITEPFAITENGYVLSGNNRLSLIRANIGKEGFNYNENSYVEGVLIKGDLSVKDMNDWELSFQNETDIKKEYEQMNVILKTKMLRENGTTNHEILKITKYKNEAAILEALSIEELYRDLLLYAGVPNAVELHRDIPMYSSLHALHQYKTNKSINQDLSRMLQNIYFKVILSTNIPVLKLRSDLFSTFITKPNISTNDKVEMLEKIQDDLDEKIHPVFVENKNNKFEKDKLKILDFSKDENNIKTTFNEVTYETLMKAKEVLSEKDESALSILKKISKSKKTINDVFELPEAWFANVDSDDSENIKRELDEFISLINNLKNKL